MFPWGGTGAGNKKRKCFVMKKSSEIISLGWDGDGDGNGYGYGSGNGYGYGSGNGYGYGSRYGYGSGDGYGNQEVEVLCDEEV